MKHKRLEKDVCQKTIHYIGERTVPNETPIYLLKEHMSRYIFAAKYAKDKNVLDLGCGVGSGSAVLIKKGASSVVGGDKSTDALAFFVKHYRQKDLSAVCLSGDSLPFCSEKFDLIVAFEVIEHVDKYKTLLEECHKILKKDGVLLLSTPNKRVDLIWRSKPQGAFHVHEFFPEEIVEIVCKRNFEIKVFGQYPTTMKRRLMLSLFGFFSKILLSLPNGHSLREQFAKILRKGFKVSRSGTEFFEEKVDEQYSILPFTENCSYLIIVCKKTVVQVG
jgi:2-polyprenyl-3-methyl-5-hydroxy-6-metoxy-1,4-benzoquinol methylase